MEWLTGYVKKWLVRVFVAPPYLLWLALLWLWRRVPSLNGSQDALFSVAPASPKTTTGPPEVIPARPPHPAKPYPVVTKTDIDDFHRIVTRKDHL